MKSQAKEHFLEILISYNFPDIFFAPLSPLMPPTTTPRIPPITPPTIAPTPGTGINACKVSTFQLLRRSPSNIILIIIDVNPLLFTRNKPERWDSSRGYDLTCSMSPCPLP